MLTIIAKQVVQHQLNFKLVFTLMMNHSIAMNANIFHTFQLIQIIHYALNLITVRLNQKEILLF